MTAPGPDRQGDEARLARGAAKGQNVHAGTDMSDELQTFEEGDRVAVMRLAPLTGEIQIVEATVLGMIDDYQAVIRFPGNDKEFSWPVGDLTRMPPRQ
jgi:hypothetical protein